MRDAIRELLKYLTNQVINYIPSYTLRYAWYRAVLGWEIGPQVTILSGVRIQMAGLRGRGRRVVIGKGSVINYGCLLYVTGGLMIGEHVSLSPGVWLITGSHDINDPEHKDIYKPIVIGSYAFLGARATVLAGVTIGEGAVVMAGAVVTHDVPPYTIVGGVPARVVGERQLRNPSYSLAHFHPLFG
ncbi:transferase [Thermogemmatispora aurantia]|jgi:acetyltransferase-like isoleucine patch superfamily enzyme|uniref:Transferase n=1 Tax=Thermogemmatispora aurantia TaxID=2045279 RepID=A0A5J4KFS0_9CHLR|nr:acyltransferase [Thermogemmatispora aurantia]GER85280.1 transferase [Thermogemmatispora aurantia]